MTYFDYPISLYGQYLKEREGKSVIECEDGFVTYNITNEGECFIQDLFIVEDARRKGLGTELIKKVESSASYKGAKYLSCGVCPLANNSTDSLQFALSYGFKLYSARQDYVILKKDII
jgi:GNAT superfamily N-acetyltransferase